MAGSTKLSATGFRGTDRAATEGGARSRSQLFCLYACIVLSSLVVVLNPLVLTWFVALSPTRMIYVATFDLLALAIVFFAARYVRWQSRGDLAGALLLLLIWPGLMTAVEMVLVPWDLEQSKARRGDAAPATRAPVMGDAVHQSDPLLGWVTRPGARAQHVSEGNFAVTYVIDERGRKAIPANPGASRTIHVFGDSLAFGHGVPNEQTALNLLAERLGSRANVANYSVMAYGLEQMYLRLRSAQDMIAPGDIVLLTPVSLDLIRNLIAKDFVCFLYEKNYSTVEIFPWRDGVKWRAERIADHCPSGDLPLAWLQRRLIAIGNVGLETTLAANADQIFAMAKTLVEKRGATFALIFIVYPDECRAGRFDFDLSLLHSDFATMMPYCLDDDGMARMRFATDRHLNAEGNRWAADALLDLLDQGVLRP